MKKTVYLMLVIMMCFGMIACGTETTDNVEPTAVKESVNEPEEPVIPTYKLYFDVPVGLSEEVLTKNSIALYLDGQSIHEFVDSSYYTQLIEEVEEGSHVVTLFMDNAPIIDSEYTFNLSSDSTLSFSVDYQEDLSANDYSLSNGIADSAISYPDMSGVAVDEALQKLEAAHFVNVHYASKDDTAILDGADWIVEEQNITPGQEIDKATEINLTCRKVYFQLYFDLDFDDNLFLAKYDVDVYMDGTSLGTIPHGNHYTNLMRVKEGDHTTTFYKSSDNSVKSEKIINISTDSTLTGRIHTNKNDIELNDFVVKESIENTSFEMKNVAGMQLDKALTELSNIGFINVKFEPYADIWDNSNWVVESQSVSAGSVIDKNAEVVLNCVKKVDYLTNTYLRLNIKEAVEKASGMNNQLRYIDYVQNMYMDNKVASMTDEEKTLWIVKQAVFKEDGTIDLRLVYTGNIEMPDVKDKVLDDALEILNKAGFSAIEAVANDNSTIINNSDWKVSKQSVEPGVRVNANGKIILTVKNNNTTTASQESNNTKPKEASKEESEDEENTDEETADEETTDENVLTEDNCEELAELLSADVVDPTKQGEFAMNHYGDIIEFDAIVADLQRKEGTKTYYSFLLVPGEDIDHIGATLFYIDYIQWRQFNWVNSPEELTITSPIRIRAKVLGGSSFIEIEPVKTWSTYKWWEGN